MLVVFSLAIAFILEGFKHYGGDFLTVKFLPLQYSKKMFFMWRMNRLN